MTVSLEGVEVALGRLDADWRKTAVIVKVGSRKKPGLFSTNEIDPTATAGARALIELVGVAAAACAEYLNKKYHDNIDESYARKLAMNAFAEEVRLSVEVSKSVPEKLTRLWGQEHLLNNMDQEFLHRCQWFVDQKQGLSHKEVMALDALINKIHGKQL